MNRRTMWSLLLAAGVFLWAVAILPAYYVVHKPLSPASFAALANVIGDLLTWLLMLAVATAIGARLTRRLELTSLLERLVFAAGLGLGILSLLTLALALTGLLYGWLFWLLLLVGGAALWKEFLSLAIDVRSVRWAWPSSSWTRFLVLFITSSLFLSLLASVLPPTEWDSLVYHLVGPERYLRAHRLVNDLDNYYLFFPSFVEMLFTAGMALKSDVVPRLIHYGYLLLTLGTLGAFATRYWDRAYGLLAAALFLSIPTAIQIAAWSYVDLALTFYGFGAVYALLNWLHSSEPEAARESKLHQAGWLIIAGLFAGFALSIKYTGVVVVLTLGALVLLWLVRRRLNVRQLLYAGPLLVGVALAVALPWYARNVVVTGNPLYPLIWGGRGWNEISTRWLLVLGQEMSILDLIVVPWTLTVVGKQGTLAYDATFSPLFLLLLPLLVVVPRRATAIVALLLTAAVGYTFWLVSGAAAYGTFVLQGRQLLPVFAPLSLLCAYTLHHMNVWNRPGLSLHRLLIMVTGITLVFGLLNQALMTVNLNPWPYLVGAQSRDDYLDQYVTQRLHQMMRYMNENLDSEDRVLFFWELRSYGLRIPHQADVVLDSFAQGLARYGTPEGLAAGLSQEGFTHLLVNHFIYPWIEEDYPILPGEKAAWDSFRARFLTQQFLVHAEGDLGLYRLAPATGP